MVENNIMDFIQNSRRRIVEDIMNEKISSQVYDDGCKMTYKSYPSYSHDLFNLPGKHHYMNSTENIRLDGGKKLADIIETILVEEYKRPVRTNVIGFQRENLNQKIEEIPDYYCLSIKTFGKLCSITIVTNSPVSKKYRRIKIDDDVFEIHFVVFDEERLYNSLNTFNNKYTDNDVVRTEDVVELSYCISNVEKPFKKDYIEKCVDFFTTRKMNKDDNRHFFYMLKESIKYHFQDDLKRKRELITMIVENIEIDEYAGLNIVDAAKLRIKNIDATIAEKDALLTKKETALMEKDATISKQETDLMEKDREIAELKLKNELLEKGNSFKIFGFFKNLFNFNS